MFRSLQFKFFVAIAWTISRIPVHWYPGLSRILLLMASPFMGKERKKLQLNVEKVYGLPAHSSFARSFEKQVFQHQAVSFMETVSSILNPRSRLEIRNFSALEQRMQQLLTKGQGVIVITGHIGSWELICRAVTEASGQTFYALAKPSKSPAFSQFLENLRSNMQTKVLWTDRKSILKDMMQTLRQNSVLGFVMDQKPEGRVGPGVDFLGLKTEFVSGPAKLALRFQAPVIAIFCMREGPMTYRVCMETVLDGSEEGMDEVVATQKMAVAIENAIRLYPEQWVWNYKRWRFAN